MSGREIPIERVAVKVASEPALAVARPGSGSFHRASAFLLIAAVYLPGGPSATPPRRPMHSRAAALFRQSSLLLASHPPNLPRISDHGGGGVGSSGGGESASGRRRAAPRSGADGGADGHLHAGRRELDRRDGTADHHRSSRRVSPVQLGVRGAVSDDGGDDPALRAAGRHIRPPARVFYRNSDLSAGHDIVRVRPIDGAADPVPRNPGCRLRRDPADRDDDHRGCLFARRASPHPGRDVGRVGFRGGGRAGDQRFSCRDRALVGRVLGEPADRGRQRRDVRAVFERTGRAAAASHRLARRRAADRRGRRADAGSGAGADPGRRGHCGARRGGHRRAGLAGAARAACPASRCCRSACGVSGCWRCAISAVSARRRRIWRSAPCCRPMFRARWVTAPGSAALSSARRRSAG